MSFNTESPQSKADLQRLYREKEGEGFADLQQAIREVTAGMVDPVKRHETLTAGMLIHSLHRKSESSLVRMKSYADNSTESLIRRGERKVLHIEVPRQLFEIYYPLHSIRDGPQFLRSADVRIFVIRDS
ncbi:hypothetical protein EV424DRAFT_1551989 [Suillus variegatus]|nr:hypothetical protein EV424DRAFT_1551989 [Suillus variegatus]